MDVNQNRSAVRTSHLFECVFGAVYVQEKAVLRLAILWVGTDRSILGVFLSRLSVHGIQLALQGSRVDGLASAGEQRDDRLRSETEPVRFVAGAFPVYASIVNG
jgi:hypothetical protein